MGFHHMTSHRFLFDIECTFKWKFTTTVHPSLILQKHILTHLNFVRHLMASIIITALFVLFRANVCTNYLMYVCFYGDRSCRHGIRSFFVEKSVNFYSLSIPTKPYSTSIGKVSSRLYRKYGENSVEVYLLALCANETISIILGQSRGFPSRTFTNGSLTILFCRSQSPSNWERYAEIMSCSVLIMLCKTLVTSLTNSLPWS